MLSVLSLTVFAQNSVPKSKIPEWFMQPSESSFIGISAPGAMEQDAVNMALLQLIIASNFKATLSQIVNTFSEESADISRGQDNGRYTIQIDTVVNYTVQDISKLEGGEYICRITNGGRHQQPIQIHWEKTDMASYNNKDYNFMGDMKLLYQAADWKCFSKYQLFGEMSENKEKNKEEYSFSCLFESPGIKSIYTSPLIAEETQTHYIFPIIKGKKYSNATSTIFSLNGTKSLFEQIMIAYWNILYDGFVSSGVEPTPNEGGGVTYHFHKATPLLGFNYDDGIFEIHYRK